MSDLDGATVPGHECSWATGPGQFAARWNRATEDERADRVRRMQEDADVALRCRWIEDHEGQLATFRHQAGEQWAKEYGAARAAEARLGSARAMLADLVEGWEREAASTDGGLVDGLHGCAEDVRAVLAGPLAGSDA